jgi:hypothetical protein
LHPHWRRNHLALTRRRLGLPEDALERVIGTQWVRPNGIATEACDLNRGPGSTFATDVIFVVGGGAAGVVDGHLRDFPRIERRKGESKRDYLRRVDRQLKRAIASGGTRLKIPYHAADWLGDYLYLTEYLVAHYDLGEASVKSEIVFVLR